MIQYKAIVKPYAEAAELPDHASWKLALGFSTLVLPPKTTKPVTIMKSRVQILTVPTAFENQYVYFVLNTSATSCQWSQVQMN